MTRFFAVGLLLISSLSFAQTPARNTKAETLKVTDTSVLVAENANLKSDLAQLRSMLNVLASQESGTDARTFGALQTQRQMWQVIIARLAELTQRLDALEKRQHPAGPDPEPPQQP